MGAVVLLVVLLGALYGGNALLNFARDYWVLILFGVAVASYGIYRFVRWKRRVDLLQHRTLGDFLALSASGFEAAVANLLRARGYRNVRVVGGSGDLAADITAIAPDSMRTVVQCKRHAPGQLIGSRELQTFLGMIVLHHMARGLYVTTGGYTQPARDLAREQGIELVDGDSLVQMALKIAATRAEPLAASQDNGTRIPAADSPSGPKEGEVKVDV